MSEIINEDLEKIRNRWEEPGKYEIDRRRLRRLTRKAVEIMATRRLKIKRRC